MNASGALLFKNRLLSAGDPGHVFVGIFVEVGEAIFAAKFYFLAVANKDIRFAVLEGFVGDDAFVERVRFDLSGAGGGVGGFVGFAATEDGSATEEPEERDGLNCFHGS